jgi:hypothetical protein
MKQNVPLAQVVSELQAPDAGTTLEQVKTVYHTAVRVQVPRDLKIVQSNVLEEMALAGSDAYYYWTVKQTNRETGKVEQVPITGPSIDGAMILIRNWGNCALAVDVVSEDQGSWTFAAVFVDLQTGFTCPRLFRQRKSEQHGKYDADRKLDIAFQIGQSKAIRNVIKNVMPVGLLRVAMERAHEAAANKYADLKKYVPAFVRKFAKLGVTVQQLEVKLDKLQSDWTPMDLATLEAIGMSIGAGETSVADEFDPIEAKPSAQAAQTVPAAKPAPAGPPSKDIPTEVLVKQAMDSIPKAEPVAPPVAPVQAPKPAAAPLAPPAAPAPVAGSTTPQTGSPDPVQPTAPPPAPVAPAPEVGSAPADDGTVPAWAQTILDAPTVRAMNAAVMAAVKAGIGKNLIDPYSSKRRSEIDAATNREGT